MYSLKHLSLFIRGLNFLFSSTHSKNAPNCRGETNSNDANAERKLMMLLYEASENKEDKR